MVVGVFHFLETAVVERRPFVGLGDLPSQLKSVARHALNARHVDPVNRVARRMVGTDASEIEPDHYHRFPGFHGDGIQGTKLTPKVNVEHSYIVTTAPATEFCLQPFFLKHLDEAKHNFFLEFDKQAKKDNIYTSLPGHLYLIDPYMVHRTPKITKKCRRVFVRITYAFTELQHPKNTVNPMFEGQQYEKRVDIRENLTPFEFAVPYHLYGINCTKKA